MLCLSGFELYSRWVPLKKVKCGTFLSSDVSLPCGQTSPNFFVARGKLFLFRAHLRKRLHHKKKYQIDNQGSSETVNH